MTDPARGDADPARFQQAFVVEASQIDALGHVNNVVYLEWIQAVAEAHWVSAATPELLEEVVWVAVRHEIDYDRPAFEGDRIVARTWVERWTAVRSRRRTEIYREGDDLALVRAVTSWCALDPKTMRPRRLPDGLIERFLESSA